MAVYLLSDGDYLKIGYTSRDIAQRMREIQTGSPRHVELISVIPSAEKAVEAELHKRFSNLRVRPNGEWFLASPEIEAEFSKRRAEADAKLQAEEEENQRRQAIREEQERRRAASNKAITSMPLEVRRRWYIRRFVVAAITLAVGFALIAITPKEPMAFWGIVRLVGAVAVPTCAYQFGKALPKAYRTGAKSELR